MERFVRGLVFCTAVLLALPQGWCCFLPLPTPCREEAPAEVAACCHGPDGVRHEPMAPTPEPAKPLKACCCQPDALAGPNVEKPQLDLGLVASVSAPAPGLAFANTPGRIDDGFHLLSPPLHLLHCVWLC
jgi:hypothetical protein